MKNLNKKTAIVTGASSGIGYAVSKTLSALGYELYGFGRNFKNTDWNTMDNAQLSVIYWIQTGYVQNSNKSRRRIRFMSL